jgi:hypothetical protein
LNYNAPWKVEDMDAYVVWCTVGNNTYFVNSWLDSWQAIRERDSLNSNDVAHYYVTYMGVIL